MKMNTEKQDRIINETFVTFRRRKGETEFVCAGKTVTDILEGDEDVIFDIKTRSWIFCASGNPVEVIEKKDGTGLIDYDGFFDTLIVKKLKDCSDIELAEILAHHNAEDILKDLYLPRIEIFKEFNIKEYDMLTGEGEFDLNNIESCFQSLDWFDIEEITEKEYDSEEDWSDEYDYEYNEADGKIYKREI